MMKPRQRTPASSSVLVDTPVWQEYFSKEERTFRQVNLLMDAGRVCCLGLVVGELLYSAASQEEIRVVQEFTRVFPVLRESSGAWVEAARLAFQLRQKGKDLSLRDSYVVHMACSNGVLLYTPSIGMRRAQRALGLKLEFHSPRRKAP